MQGAVAPSTRPPSAAAPNPPRAQHLPRTVDHVVVSVSLGASSRNSRAEDELFGKRYIVERIGVDGNLAHARTLLEGLDGNVDALGLGGADLALNVNGHRYPFRKLRALTAGLHTPITDGSALRRVAERRVMQRCAAQIDALLALTGAPRRALITTAVDRYDLACSFDDAGYELLLGDLGFVFGVPVALHSLRALHTVARVALPLATRRTYENLHTPPAAQPTPPTARLAAWFAWATAIGGDALFLRRALPARLDGKIIVTNAATEEDVADWRVRGALALVATTPRFEGRTFGTNVIEAALIALAGRSRTLTPDELRALVGADGLPPTVELLNPPPGMGGVQ